MISGNMSFAVALREAHRLASRSQRVPGHKLRLLERVLNRPMRVDPSNGRLINVVLKIEKRVRLELDLTETNIDWQQWIAWIKENLPEILRFLLTLLAFLDNPNEETV